MHRSLGIALIGFCLLLGGYLPADAAGGTSGRIGYVDLQRTLNETVAGKKAKKKLETDKKTKQRELDKKQEALQKFAAELDKQRVVLKPDVLRQRERELQERYVKLQEIYLKLQQDLAKQEAMLVQEIFGKASPIIKKIAQSKGFAMVLEKNESAVLWADGSLDITSEVNAALK